MKDLIKFQQFAYGYKNQLIQTLGKLDLNKIAEAVDLIANCRGTIWLIGNGGSAALSSHMATDLQLAGKRAIAMTDVAAVTTYANDNGYTSCFRKQLDALSSHKDILISISGSGNSENVYEALWGFPGQNILITGFKGGKMGMYANMKGFNGLHINVPANHMGVNQDGHQIVLHMICYWLMEKRKIQ